MKARKAAQPPPSEPTRAAPRASLTETDVAHLYLETMCSRTTIQRWARGDVVTSATHLRLDRACKKLGIEMRPPEPRRRLVDVKDAG
jgi:hypothetical protein